MGEEQNYKYPVEMVNFSRHLCCSFVSKTELQQLSLTRNQLGTMLSSNQHSKATLVLLFANQNFISIK
jgi:hypothetical protein